jgi:hypothetical protein
LSAEAFLLPLSKRGYEQSGQGLPGYDDKRLADAEGEKSMNGKQAKKCRGAAYKEASKQGAWKKIAKTLQWWRKLLAVVFPRLSRRYNGWIGRAYKRLLKAWTKEVYVQNVVQRDERYRMARKQARLSRVHTHKVLEAAAKGRVERGLKYDKWGRTTAASNTTTLEEKR